MGTDLQLEEDAREVVFWRRDQLVHAGFTPPAAAQLADDPRYDLHVLMDLVGRSCPPGLAVRILAPLEEDEAA